VRLLFELSLPPQFPYFCRHGAKLFDELFPACGATRKGETNEQAAKLFAAQSERVESRRHEGLQRRR